MPGGTLAHECQQLRRRLEEKDALIASKEAEILMLAERCARLAEENRRLRGVEVGERKDAETLGVYVRTTAKIPNEHFQTACDVAVAECDGWPPSVKAINKAGERVPGLIRKRTRERAS